MANIEELKKRLAAGAKVAEQKKKNATKSVSSLTTPKAGATEQKAGEPSPTRKFIKEPVKIQEQVKIEEPEIKASETVTESTFSPPYGTTTKALQKWYDEDPEGYNAWLSAGGRAGGEVSKEEKAQALLDEQRQKQREKEMELYGYYITPESDEAQTEELIKKQEKQKTSLQQQIETLNKLDTAQLRESAAVGKAAIAGTEERFAQDREGVISEANPLIAKQFQSKVQTNIENQTRRLNLVMQQRADQLAQLEEAQKSGKQKLADALIKNLAAAENQIDQIQLDLANASAEATKQAFDFIDKVGIDAFAETDIGTLQGLFPTMDTTQIFGIQSIAKKKKELQMDDPDYLQKLANLEKTQRELQTAGLTTEQKNYLFAQGLPESEREGFMDWAAKNPTYQHFTVGDKVYSFDPKTGQANVLVGENDGDYQPTGQFATATIGTREITLDTGALATFQQAYASLQSELGDVPFQAENTASKRDINMQKQIYGKGRTMDELLATGSYTSEEAALMAKPDMSQVTWTLQSKHVQGLAVDFNFEGKNIDYINKVEQAMNSQGWERPIPGEDPGHFVFNGKQGFNLTASEELQVGDLSTQIFGKRAGSKPEKLNLVKRAFVENGKNLDNTQDALRLAGYAPEFSGTLKSAFDEVAQSAKLSDSLTKANQDRFEDILQTYGKDSLKAKEFLINFARSGADSAQKQAIDGRIALVNNLAAINGLLDQYIAKNGDTGLISGNIQKAQEKLGQIGDPELANIGNQIMISVQEYRKALSGAAFTESEAKEYERIFPSTGKVPELNRQKINSIGSTVERNLNSYFKTVLSPSNFNELFPNGAIPVILGKEPDIVKTTNGLPPLATANKFGFDQLDNSTLIDETP